MYYGLAPASGNCTITVTMDADTSGLAVGAVVLNNMKQEAPKSSSSASGNGTDPTTTLRTHVANSIIVEAVSCEPGDEDISVNSGQTERNEQSGSFIRYNTSTELVASAGLQTCAWSMSGAQPWGIFAATFEPYDQDTEVNYSSGSGTATLTFASLTVTDAMAEQEIDGVYIDLNGGDIDSVDDSTDVTSTDDIIVIPTGTDAGSLKFQHDITIDHTAPTIPGDIGILYNGSYEADHDGGGTFDTAGKTIDILLPIDGQVYTVGNPYHPILSLYVGPATTTVGYAYSLGPVQISGTWYLKMRLTLTAGMRTGDLQTLAVGSALDLNGCTVQDTAGNDLTVTLPETDVGQIVLAVPKDWDLSSGGDYADFSAFDTATYSVSGDSFDVNFTGNLDTDEPGTENSRITVTGRIDGNVTIDENYWTLDDLNITGSLTISGDYLEINP